MHVATDRSVLEQRIDYHFAAAILLAEAMTHRSFSNEHPAWAHGHNERLEFLGDAVLDLTVSDMIFRNYPEFSEGTLTRIRAEVVSEKSLAGLARQLDLGQYLQLGKGEERSGGRDKDSLLANALEALLGAVYCDRGLDAVGRMVRDLFAEMIQTAAGRKTSVDFKTRLQEFLQGQYGRPPGYVLVQAQGPDHERIYDVEVRLGDEVIGRGQGRTKKSAEQEAARWALTHLQN